MNIFSKEQLAELRERFSIDSTAKLQQLATAGVIDFAGMTDKEGNAANVVGVYADEDSDGQPNPKAGLGNINLKVGVNKPLIPLSDGGALEGNYLTMQVSVSSASHEQIAKGKGIAVGKLSPDEYAARLAAQTATPASNTVAAKRVMRPLSAL